MQAFWCYLHSVFAFVGSSQEGDVLYMGYWFCLLVGVVARQRLYDKRKPSSLLIIIAHVWKKLPPSILLACQWSLPNKMLSAMLLCGLHDDAVHFLLNRHVWGWDGIYKLEERLGLAWFGLNKQRGQNKKKFKLANLKSIIWLGSWHWMCGKCSHYDWINLLRAPEQKMRLRKHHHP